MGVFIKKKKKIPQKLLKKKESYMETAETLLMGCFINLP